ncbi:hypothetical protein SLEP1_g43446 [Rubroshorea leprosula]|uniref:Uncharacterized protein n=1 Tax=Rubroshorea leprosula TaxID=152421 RepID=A0AAV5LDT1_9ROSI|nr:hypothetical protein SLEP1_g43446 [Rubroshorea leprosula]
MKIASNSMKSTADEEALPFLDAMPYHLQHHDHGFMLSRFEPPAPLCCVTDGEFNSGIEFPTGEFIGETVGLLRFNFDSRKYHNGPGLGRS